jgi:hypothetical protein
MTIIQCTFCKKPFHSIGSRICTVCSDQIEEDYKVVRDFIYDNSKASIDDVAEETGVSKQIILYLLKEGWLRFEESAGGSYLKCEGCKKPINTSRFCDDCKDDVSSVMKKSIGKDNQGKHSKNLRHGMAKIGK